MLEQYQIFKDEAGEWRWRLIAKNSKIVAVSGEGYKRRSAAINAAKKMPDVAKTTVIAEVLN